MQQDASPYAVRNLVIRPLFNADNAKMQEETDTGTKRSEDVAQVKELLEQIMQDEKLMELYEKRIKELEGQLEKAAQEQFYTDAPRQQAPSLTKEQQLKKQKSDALAKIRRGIAKTRGQLSAGIPIDSELIDGMIELARYYVSAGI
jgi:valyl-tRNA synthetase